MANFAKPRTDKQDEVKKKLQETVAKHFEVRQQRRAMELKQLGTELTRLRLESRSRSRTYQEKQQIIDRRVVGIARSRGQSILRYC